MVRRLPTVGKTKLKTGKKRNHGRGAACKKGRKKGGSGKAI